MPPAVEGKLFFGRCASGAVFIEADFFGQCITINVFLVDVERLLRRMHGVEIAAEIGNPLLQGGMTSRVGYRGLPSCLGAGSPKILDLHGILEPRPSDNLSNFPVGFAAAFGGGGGHAKKIPPLKNNILLRIEGRVLPLGEGCFRAISLRGKHPISRRVLGIFTMPETPSLTILDGECILPKSGMISKNNHRAWDKLEKRFIYPHRGYQPHYCLSLSGTFFDLHNGSGGEEYIVQQSTGLVDRHGGEVYEGDILRHPSSGGSYVCNWDSSEAGFVLTPVLGGAEPGDFARVKDLLHILEVTGNTLEE